MFKIFTVVAILTPGILFADDLTPDQTGVINKTDPSVVDVFPTSTHCQITDVVSQAPDTQGAESDCDPNREVANDQEGCDPNSDCGAD